MWILESFQLIGFASVLLYLGRKEAKYFLISSQFNEVFFCAERSFCRNGEYM